MSQTEKNECSRWVPEGSYSVMEIKDKKCPEESANVRGCVGCDFQHQEAEVLSDNVCPYCGVREDAGLACRMCRDILQSDLMR